MLCAGIILKINSDSAYHVTKNSQVIRTKIKTKLSNVFYAWNVKP